MNPLDVQRLEHIVVLQGAPLLELRHLLTLGARERLRRDGVPASPTLRYILAVTTAAIDVASATSSEQVKDRTRHGDMTKGTDPSRLSWVDREDEITTKEAAVLLGVGIRQVQRLASLIGSRRVNGALVFDRGAVTDFAAQRQQEMNE
jgi:hypothetical protein